MTWWYNTKRNDQLSYSLFFLQCKEITIRVSGAWLCIMKQAASCTVQVVSTTVWWQKLIGSIRNSFPPDCHWLLRLLKTLSPPVPAVAHLLHPEHEAGRLADVEEQVAHDVSRLIVHHFEARAEPVVARAVHHSMEFVVEKAVEGFTGVDGQGADEVMVPTAPIRGSVPSKLHRLVRSPSWSAPLRPRHPHQVLWKGLLLVRSRRVPANRRFNLYIEDSLLVGGVPLVDNWEQGDDCFLLDLGYGQLARVKLACKQGDIISLLRLCLYLGLFVALVICNYDTYITYVSKQNSIKTLKWE